MIEKTHIKSRNVCKVTFSVSAEQLGERKVDSVAVLGDFNEWQPEANTMKWSKKHDAYRAAIELDPDARYEFRYLLDGEHWFNEWEADDYCANQIDGDNCVVMTPAGN